jgi:mannose-1-phosphate guanylyltransferase
MYIVLMAGGVGTRFWPMSRRSMPKQVLQIIGSESMIEMTYKRISSLTTPEKILVITSREIKSSIEKLLPEIPKENIIAEPVGKNTAPCIGLAGTIIQARNGDDDVMIVLPADHLVSEVEKFQNVLKMGLSYAHENDCLITLGVQPNYPETGYGYIQKSEKLFKKNGIDIFKVKTFAEKPNLETAKRFLQSGDFLWNSGIFIWQTKRIMAEIDENLPELSANLQKIRNKVDTDKFYPTLKDIYSRTKSISIDYAVMEVAKKVCVIRADFSWNDLGSWEAVYKIAEKDRQGNVVSGKHAIMLNSSNNYVYSKKKVIAAIDVTNLIVVEMDDAILICNKEKSQDVKKIVELLEREELEQYL